MDGSRLRSKVEAASREATASQHDRAGAARLLPVLAPVILAGLLVIGIATWSLVSRPPSLAAGAGLLALLVAATLAEAFPVPLDLEGVAAGAVSLAAVFIVGAAILFGAAPAVVIAFVVLALVQLQERRGALRLAYNTGVYALCGAAAGAAAGLVHYREGLASLLLAVVSGTAAFYVVNVCLVAAIVARSAQESFGRLLGRSVRLTLVPFSIMASLTLTLAVLWERSPVLTAALVGPLAAVALYQRSVHEALEAMRLALTDPLTGLGNRRHFHERLQRDLDRAEAQGTSLAVCLFDLDDFKEINDRYGHPVGDAVLADVAALLRGGGEAFRLGGDEFALLLPGRDDREALAVAERVLGRVGELESPHGRVNLSAGVASYPHQAIERSELVRVADSALYWSKEDGKGRARAFRRDASRADLHDPARRADPPARLPALAGGART